MRIGRAILLKTAAHARKIVFRVRVAWSGILSADNNIARQNPIREPGPECDSAHSQSLIRQPRVIVGRVEQTLRSRECEYIARYTPASRSVRVKIPKVIPTPRFLKILPIGESLRRAWAVEDFLLAAHIVQKSIRHSNRQIPCPTRSSRRFIGWQFVAVVSSIHEY